MSDFVAAVPPGDALIVIGIDGMQKALDVNLPEGINDARVAYNQHLLDDSVQLAAWNG